MILVDTSVWIDLLGRRPTHTLPADRLIDVATCAPIVQEVLQGVRDDVAHHTLRDRMRALHELGNPIATDSYLQAADLYRSGRRRGYTIRSSVDCLIATLALQHRATVWHVDRDFRALARYTDLRTFEGKALD